MTVSAALALPVQLAAQDEQRDQQMHHHYQLIDMGTFGGRGNGGQKQNLVSMPKKKTMSAAARRKIAAAQRARWAKVKAAQKKSA